MSRPLLRTALRSRLAIPHRSVQPIRFPHGCLRLSPRYIQTEAHAAKQPAPETVTQDSIDPYVKRPQIKAKPPASETAAQDSIDPYVKQPRIKAKAEIERRMKRLRYAVYGLLLSVLGTAAVGYQIMQSAAKLEQEQKLKNQGRKGAIQLDASSSTSVDFQGKPVHIIGAGQDKRIVAEGKQDVDLVETGTSSVPYFPKTIYLPTGSATAALPATTATPNPSSIDNEEYTLLGLGIRTVSIFSIQVYVLGLYIRTADLSTLQSSLIHSVLDNETASTLVPSERDLLRQALLDPARGADIWARLLASGVRTAWRISPTRNTDFAHLRDGWITGIKRGTQAAAALGPAGDAQTKGYESDEFGAAVRAFKEQFAGWGSAAKGSVVTLARDAGGGLDVYFEDPGAKRAADEGRVQRVGRVEDGRVAGLIWMGYVAGKNVSSEAARKAVVEGCVGLASRPVGSAETMVA